MNRDCNPQLAAVSRLVAEYGDAAEVIATAGPSDLIQSPGVFFLVAFANPKKRSKVDEV